MHFLYHTLGVMINIKGYPMSKEITSCTYVPPTPPEVSEEMVAKGSSQIATEAPKLAANRDARIPPLPAPMVKRSKS